VIFGFENGSDVVQVASNFNGLSVSSAGDLAVRVSTDASGNAVIDLGAGNQLTFVGVDADDLVSNIDSIIQII